MKRLVGSIFRGLLLLAVVGGILAAVVWSFRPPPLAVELAAIDRGPLRVTVDEDGKTRIKERYVVSAPLSGRLLRIELKAGDRVYRGNTQLAIIEPSPPEILDARALARAKAQVEAARAALARAEPVVERARAEWQFAESELARLRMLASSRAVSTNEVEQAEMLYRAREQDLRAARFAEDVARFELKMAEAALLHAQPDEHQPGEPEPGNPFRLAIHSPIDGYVLRVLQESEAVVQTGTALLELGDPKDLEVEVDVLSFDAVRIAPGTRVWLEQWGGDRPLRATVRLVEPAAFTKISALGVEEQRVNVILDIDDPPDQWQTLGDAFRVEARVVIWEAEDVLLVPTGALFRQRDQWAVFVVQDGQAVLRNVQIGQRNSLAAQVLEGLQPGDQVILHPSDRIADGARVVPRS